MTADEYYTLVSTFDQRQQALIQKRIDDEIDRIPQNINRAGKVYKKRCNLIREKYETRRPSGQPRAGEEVLH